MPCRCITLVLVVHEEQHSLQTEGKHADAAYPVRQEAGVRDPHLITLCPTQLLGPDLTACMQSGRLGPHNFFLCAERMLTAVESLHRCGLVHRDIKPGACCLYNDFWVPHHQRAMCYEHMSRYYPSFADARVSHAVVRTITFVQLVAMPATLNVVARLSDAVRVPQRTSASGQAATRRTCSL